MSETSGPAPTKKVPSRRRTAAATTTAKSASAPTRRLLQRQIMPIDRDFDVFALYVDPEDAKLDADKYEVGGNRAAKDLNNAAIRQSTRSEDPSGAAGSGCSLFTRRESPITSSGEVA